MWGRARSARHRQPFGETQGATGVVAADAVPPSLAVPVQLHSQARLPRWLRGLRLLPAAGLLRDDERVQIPRTAATQARPRPLTAAAGFQFFSVPAISLRRRLWLNLSLTLLPLCALLPAGALFFSEPILCVEDANAGGDVMVVLGGKANYRPPRVLDLDRK